MASDFDWTAEAIVCLRAFWDEGLSTADSVVHGSALELWKALEQSELFSITVSQA